MQTWTPEAAYATEHHPTILRGFAVTVAAAELGAGASNTVTFAIGCKTCGGATFRISAFPKAAPDPSPYYDVGAGETFLRPPHGLTCVGCGAGGPLFDARTDGYDGVLNGGCAYESGEGAPSPVPGAFGVTVAVTYNIDLDELREVAAEAGVEPSDLFDWIVIGGSPTDGGSTFEQGYECA